MTNSNSNSPSLFLDNGRITIGSLDVKSMFPNLKAVQVSKMVADALKDCTIEFAGIDYQMVGIYLALNYSRQEMRTEGLHKFIPDRIVKSKGVSKITIASKECRSPNEPKEK